LLVLITLLTFDFSQTWESISLSIHLSLNANSSSWQLSYAGWFSRYVRACITRGGLIFFRYTPYLFSELSTQSHILLAALYASSYSLRLWNFGHCFDTLLVLLLICIKLTFITYLIGQ
jgi:hypothetical protein